MREAVRPELYVKTAIVILGGLITSTLLNLFVVPSLYLAFGRAKKVEQEVAQMAAAD